MSRALAMLLAMVVVGAGAVVGSESDPSSDSSKSARASTDAIQSGVIVDCEIYIGDDGKERLASRPQVQLSRPDFKSPSTCEVGTIDETGARLIDAGVSITLVDADHKSATLDVAISHFKRSPSRKETRISEFRETIDLGRPHEFTIPGCNDDHNLLRVVLIPQRQEEVKRKSKPNEK